MNIGIIGAGATGLTAGYELAKKGHKVSIFESRKGYGGLVETVNVGGQMLEKYYHHIFTSDLEIVDMINELGLSKELLWQSPRSSIYMNGTPYPFSSPLDLLMFKELSYIERILMGLLVFKAKFVKNWKCLESISAKEWIIKNAGKGIYEKVWKPLLNSKFDCDSDKVSAVWIWNKFKLRGSTRGSYMSGELFGYMDGSFGIVYDRLVEKITEMGGSVHCSRTVNKIRLLGDKTLEVITESSAENFDRVIVTASPQVLANLAPSLPERYLEQISNIKYKSNICVLLELDRQLSPYYWVTVADEKLPFVLVIEHTDLIPVDVYKSHIVYLSRYLDEANELFTASDEYISELFISSLGKMFPSFDRSEIKKTSVFRERFAQPVVGKEYSKVKPAYETPMENLYLASMAQIYPEDRGQNYSVRMGREIAQIILARDKFTWHNTPCND